MQPENFTDNGSMAFAKSPNLIQHNQLQSKVALVIGGGNKSGRALALSLAERGAHLVVVCPPDIPLEGYDLQRKVAQIGRLCLLIAGDPTNRAFAQQVMQEIKARFGHLDIFIDSSTLEEAVATDENPIFPHFALTKAALQQIALSRHKGADFD